MAERTSTPAAVPALDLQLVADLARKAAGPVTIPLDTAGLGEGLPSAVPLLFSPLDGRLLDLRSHIEAFRLQPQRKTGTAAAQTLGTFIDLVNRHKTEHTAIFADTNWEAPSFQAVIDYHRIASTEPDHLRHRIHYAFPLSEEWKTWMKSDGEPMSQAEFAAFLEDRIADLSSPNDMELAELPRQFQTTIATPSELIQLSRGLEVNVEARVKNIVTLQTGEGQIVWEETHKDSAGLPLRVPGLFILRIAPFFMGEPVRAPVRLRYRASGGTVKWFYQIYRPDRFITERIREDLRIAGAETVLPTFEGTPERGQ